MIDVEPWRKLIEAMPDEPARWKIFEAACQECSQRVTDGSERALVIDRLAEFADMYSLDVDEAQKTLAAKFIGVKIAPPKPNGKHGREQIITPTQYVIPQPDTIPARMWLYGRHYMRGVVTATVAPGGFGKTTLALYEALTMAADGIRVWYVSGEDDRNEIDRRIAAHFDLYPECAIKIAGNLFVDDKMSFPLKIAKSSRDGPEFDIQRMLAFERAIELCRIDLVTLDPFVSFHMLSENDTAAMDLLVKTLGEICFRRNCCLELSHHVRKPGMGQLEITVYDARGAASIVNAVRSCRVLNHMSKEEATRAGIKEHRTSYVRVDSGKRNMAPPEKARWHKIVSRQIANQDWVQALEDWEFKIMDATRLSADDNNWLRVMVASKQYRADSRSPEWLGLEFATHFQRDPKLKEDIIWINQAINQMITDNVIEKFEGVDTDRKKRVFFRVCPKRDNVVKLFEGNEDVEND